MGTSDCCEQKLHPQFKPQLQQVSCTVRRLEGKQIWHSIEETRFKSLFEPEQKGGLVSKKALQDGECLIEEYTDGRKVLYQGPLVQRGSRPVLHGVGSMLTSQALSSGVFEHGKLKEGVSVYSKDCSFQGKFQNGEPSKGKFKNGNFTYEGEMKDFKKHGHGTQSNGVSEFSGQYFKGQPVRGKFVFDKRDPSFYYEGELIQRRPKNGRLNKGNEYYVTQFVTDEKGEPTSGKVHYGNGHWYKGGLSRGLRHGKGEYHAPDLNEVFTGQFVEGQRDGAGILQIENNSYEAEYSRGKLLALRTV